ncbi:ABC transporter substrate-binding protein [Myxococcota bacterium]|nr:ABC transporter substrate-binding protein [Myxococcota bacterium]MBU1379294.1 ABC transporter substrate-binding protein [Myxococcota bacterium]MBU1497873.1 ABC transporter substrate-binding protein [Myxococcota bacterium]
MRTIITVLFLSFLPSVVYAGCPETAEKCDITASRTPKESIKEFRTLVEKNVKSGMSEGAKRVFMNIMSNYFDFNLMAQASMGGEWKNLTEEEKTEFKTLFGKMIRTSYLKKLINHSSYDVTLGSEKSNTTNARVKTTLKKKTGKSQPIEVEYRLIKQGNSWKIYDVVTDEVSLVKNYRSTFISIYKKNGSKALMDHLKKNTK